jgi:hypothetical protein
MSTSFHETCWRFVILFVLWEFAEPLRLQFWGKFAGLQRTVTFSPVPARNAVTCKHINLRCSVKYRLRYETFLLIWHSYITPTPPPSTPPHSHPHLLPPPATDSRCHTFWLWACAFAEAGQDAVSVCRPSSSSLVPAQVSELSITGRDQTGYTVYAGYCMFPQSCDTRTHTGPRFIVSSEGRESYQPQVIRASHTNSKILVPDGPRTPNLSHWSRMRICRICTCSSKRW